MKKVLLIEDNPDIRENTAEILTLAGYDVLVAGNGKEGVEIALKDKPDLIICDIMMPELDGYGVLHILSRKEQTARIPFIFLTAKTEKSDVRRGMNLGADDYLTKPFDDADLLAAIDARLQKSALQNKLYDATGEGVERFIHDASQLLNLKDLAKEKRTKLFKKKSEIFAEGDPPHNVYFVRSGQVKLSKLHPEGKELITAIVHTNDFFGFEPILEGTACSETATAIQDTELIIIPRLDFITYFQAPEVSAAFVSLMCKKIAEKESQLVNLAYNSVRQRTAEALLRLVTPGKPSDDIHISRDDLSKIVGTATESVIRMLADFRDEKLVETDGTRIRIISVPRLEKVVRWSFAK